MKKLFVFGAALSILVLSGCSSLIIGNNTAETPGETTNAGSVPPAAIAITAQGFSPATVTVPIGTNVVFTNQDSLPHWPASGVHPTHEICPGFDSKRALETNQSYNYTFTEAKVCPMHDHLNPALKGKITVRP